MVIVRFPPYILSHGLLRHDIAAGDPFSPDVGGIHVRMIASGIERVEELYNLCRTEVSCMRS